MFNHFARHIVIEPFKYQIAKTFGVQKYSEFEFSEFKLPLISLIQMYQLFIGRFYSSINYSDPLCTLMLVFRHVESIGSQNFAKILMYSKAFLHDSIFAASGDIADATKTIIGSTPTWTTLKKRPSLVASLTLP